MTDTAVIRTPSIPRRLASMLYETLLLVGVVAVLVLLPHVLLGMASGLTAAAWLLQAHLVVVLAAYFVWFWGHGGQTLAMKTWKIRLADARSADGSAAVKLPQALLRFVLCWPSLFFFGAGLVWALLDRDGQFMHDRLAGTRLVLVG